MGMTDESLFISVQCSRSAMAYPNVHVKDVYFGRGFNCKDNNENKLTKRKKYKYNNKKIIIMTIIIKQKINNTK
jgi:hypothetical protein